MSETELGKLTVIPFYAPLTSIFSASNNRVHNKVVVNIVVISAGINKITEIRKTKYMN